MNTVFLDSAMPIAETNVSGINNFVVDYIKEKPIIPLIVVGLIGISVYLVIRNNQLKKSFGVTNGQAARVAAMGL